MKEQLLKTLETSREYTLRVAEAMPEDTFLFKPEGAGWNFSELLNHIAYSIYWWRDNVMLGNETAWAPPEPETNKTDTIAYIKTAYDALRETLEQVPVNDNTVYGFFSTTDHITHHRGQAVSFLRCNAIIPPDYTF